MEATTFTCSICGEPSHRICVYCTKDACGNHLCDRCQRCSDCCECDQPRMAHEENGADENAQPASVQSAEITAPQS